MKTRICLGLLAGLFLLSAPLSAQPPPRGGAGKLRQFQEQLEAAKAEGVDTTRAEELSRLSHRAMKSGNRQEADALIEQAIEALPAQKPGVKTSPVSPVEHASPRGAKPAPSVGQAPVFLMAFTHHYSGPGGYYPRTEEVAQIGSFFHGSGIRGTLFFDGILIERLQQEAPDLIGQIRAWDLPLGYHGEETHGPYPVGSELMGEVYRLPEAQDYQGVWSLTTGKLWDEAVRSVVERYSHARPYAIDPATRRLERRDASPTDLSRVGGLALVQQVLGKDVAMMTSHGLESAPEGFAFRQMSRFGFDQPAIPTALHALRIFRVEQLADRLMSIAGRDISIFWHMGRLTCKGDSAAEAGWRLGPLRRELESLDLSQPRLLLVGFSKLDESEAQQTVDYVNREFIPAHPGSAWVSGDTLPGFFEAEKEFAPTPSDLAAAARALLDGWQGRPPDYVTVGSRVYSLCDVYESLLLAWSGYLEQGRFPDRVQLGPLYGPLLEDPRPG
ncbi:MAG: hypothetical protein V2A34_12945, partial [Lentisphaerota bacterium]